MPIAVSWSADSWSKFCLRAIKTSFAPAMPKACAMAWPKPELPPVTKAVRPDKSNETGEGLMMQRQFVNG
jgi:hypothetical protein